MSLIGKITGADGAKRAAKDADLFNRKLIADTDSRNTALLQPGVDTFGAANSQINALLGIGGDPSAAEAAFQTFRDGTGYDFRRQEALDGALQRGAVTSGIGSGKTLKALQDRASGVATGSFNDYLQSLFGQQGVGANFVGQQFNNNNAMLDRGMGVTNTRANAVANASLVNGGFTTNLLASMGGAALGGGPFGKSGGAGSSPTSSSYGGGMDPLAIAKVAGYAF